MLRLHRYSKVTGTGRSRLAKATTREPEIGRLAGRTKPLSRDIYVGYVVYVEHRLQRQQRKKIPHAYIAQLLLPLDERSF